MITTERLILRTWTEADRAPFAALSRDPEVMAFVTPHPDRAASEAWIDRQVAAQSSDGFCFWAVEHSGSFVGAVGLLRVRYPAHFTPAIEVGWRIARASWGRGFAPEAAGAALRFGFTTLAVPEIVANTIATNARSLRVMAKIGMTRNPADDFDHPLVPDGDALRRQVLYRITREHWAALFKAVPGRNTCSVKGRRNPDPVPHGGPSCPGR